jgi:D-tagatose-1,6-bisphosphate aldolase subunit GatZ/KbaZ
MDYDKFVYEAHSTDYQTEKNLTALDKDHFCILKVGPWLTFALREALFALESIEKELLSMKDVPLSNLKDTLERVMLENPGNWKKYYHGDLFQQRFKRKYSFSDRIRYYWTNEELVNSVKRLMKNLKTEKIPLSILDELMPNQYQAVRENKIINDPEQLAIHRVREVLGIYARACNLSK